MKSILEGRPDLAREINKVAEVAGYLWQKGWVCPSSLMSLCSATFTGSSELLM